MWYIIWIYENCCKTVKLQSYGLSPAGPGYTGPGASPTQAAGEPFAADSPYFPFSARPGSRLSPAKAKIIPSGLRPTKDEPQQPGAATIDNQWAVVSPYFLILFKKQIKINARDTSEGKRGNFHKFLS